MESERGADRRARSRLLLGALLTCAIVLGAAGLALGATGDLTPKDCIADVGDTAGCGATQQGLLGAEGIAASADGRSVYVGW